MTHWFNSDDLAWTLVREGTDFAREREAEALFTIGNGYMGTRGLLAEASSDISSSATFLAGVFDASLPSIAVPELSVGPDWTKIRIISEGEQICCNPQYCLENRRILNMRQGILHRECRYSDFSEKITLLRESRIASLADRHIWLQIFQLIPQNYSGILEIDMGVETASAVVGGFPVARSRLLSAGSIPGKGVLFYRTPHQNNLLALISSSEYRGNGTELVGQPHTLHANGLCAERWTISVQKGQQYEFRRLVVAFLNRDGVEPETRAMNKMVQAKQEGLDKLVLAHMRHWNRCWRCCDVKIEGDAIAQRAIRFAAYHLIISANPDDERISIGARSLSGESYKGHVFWDTEIFMLPFFIFNLPHYARSLLMYRYHTLYQAKEKARSLGFCGALYAWESADTGEETTPSFILSPDGETIPVVAGQQEHHISADVAYAVWSYWEATADESFLLEAGVPILVETARFWASRGEWGEDGKFHILHIMGPDEYHENINDNAYTNWLAKWNLEKGVQVVSLLKVRWPDLFKEWTQKLRLMPEEIEQWSRIARQMYCGFDVTGKIIQQFEGFFALEDVDLQPMRQQGKWSAPLDMIWGRKKTQKTQLVKQADVIMLLFLLWDYFPNTVREASFYYYEPRTCHGSSLSPAIHAWVAARLGDVATAEKYFRMAADIDLGNGMGNVAGGVHAAALGGLWQAAVFGLGGVKCQPQGFSICPCMPKGWSRLQFNLWWQRSLLKVEIVDSQVRVQLQKGKPLRVQRQDGEWEMILPNRTYQIK